MQIFKTPFLRKVFLLLVFVTAFGFGTLTLWISSSVKSSFRETQLKTLEDIEKQYKRSLLGWLSEKQKNMEGLARMLAFSPEIESSMLRAFRDVYPEYADILIIDREGKLLHNSGSVLLQRNIDLSDRAYFQAAIGGKVFISGFFRGRSRGMATLSISAPVVKADKPESVVAGFITLQTFLDIFRAEVTRTDTHSPILSIHLINTKGQVISDPVYIERYPKDPSIEEDPAFRSDSAAVKELLNRREGALVYSYKGRGFYGAFSWIEPLQIGLVVEADKEVLERSLDLQLRSLVVVSILVFCILVGVLVFVLWYLSKPLSQLNLAMERVISEGPKGTVAFKKTGSHVDRLVDTFNQLQEVVYQRETELKDRAARDSLTGLYNHGMLQEFLQKEFQRRKRSGKPVCFLMADIDHFKDINDNYGHGAGDRVLQEVSRVLESCVRSGDLVARYGGEEFAILVDSDKPEVSQSLAERIRSRVASHAFAVEGKLIPVTVSVGWVCVYPQTVMNYTDIVKEADDHMYRAKEAGRNRVFGQAYLS